MSVPAHRLSACLLPVVSLVWLSAGCSSHIHSYTESKSLWESPIVRETRALLSVRCEELSILRVDGRSAQVSHLGQSPVKEYFLSGGEHSVTAAFKYADSGAGGVATVVRGMPITLRQPFRVGHRYEAVYRQFVRPLPEPKYLLDQIVATMTNPPQEFWTLEIVDVTETAKATD